MLGYSRPAASIADGPYMSGAIGPDSRPVASVDDLVDYFTSGAKAPEAWRLGIEQEKLAVFPDGRVVGFDGPAGIEALLTRFEALGAAGVREDGRLVALKDGEDSITIEPGGQVEQSAPPYPTAIACRAAIQGHLTKLVPLARELGMRFLGVGLRPWGGMDDIPWLPKRRYAVMRDYLPTRGRLGHQMMKRTATVQVNLDYDSEQTAVEKMRAALAVTSVVTALMAASPIVDGRPSGYKTYRAAIWLDTDEDRCGLLPFVFDEGFGFRQYADWALGVPMFFVVRDGVYHPAGGMTFGRFMTDGWNGQQATIGDWEIHLSTLFPEVRLKRDIEVRGADAGPMAFALALPALWRGLLDDPETRRATIDMVRGTDVAEREALRRLVPRAGLDARLSGRTLRELAVELCALAATGLSRLPGGAQDQTLLAPLQERAGIGRAPADDMLTDYAACGGDPTKLVKRWELTPDL